MNLAHIDTQFEVAIDLLERLAQVSGDGRKRESGNMHVARLGKVDFPSRLTRRLALKLTCPHTRMRNSSPAPTTISCGAGPGRWGE